MQKAKVKHNLKSFFQLLKPQIDCIWALIVTAENFLNAVSHDSRLIE